MDAGQDFSIDVVVEGATKLYASELHLRRDGGFSSERAVVGVDADPGLPGFQFAVSGDGLALTGKERLNTTIVGFLETGDRVRSCNFDLDGSPTAFGSYDFVKGGIGDSGTANVDSSQVVPTNSSVAKGSGTFTLNAAHTELKFEIKVDMSALTGAFSQSHIHNGAPGVNGGLCGPLPMTSLAT